MTTKSNHNDYITSYGQYHIHSNEHDEYQPKFVYGKTKQEPTIISASFQTGRYCRRLIIK